MKKVLGLDLGTTSIGWALVNEKENSDEKSSIIRTGVRVIPITTDESNDFQKGKSSTINSDRTSKRSARRGLQRFKLRRNELIKILKQNNLITNETVLSETGSNSTFKTWELRARAASSIISSEEFARVLLAINKKRGYKSSRKTKDEGDGQAIDGMEIAKILYEDKLTPGQFVIEYFKKGKKNIPEFYRSDLSKELSLILEKQKEFYSEILTDELKESLKNKNKSQSWAICQKPFGIAGIKRSTKGFEQKKENYLWRVISLTEKLDLEQLAIVIQEINNQINQSSGYLGEISDRSKQLIINKMTIGEYIYGNLKNDPHFRSKQKVFYRQDYMDEFERIWEIQKQFHVSLTDELKYELRDVIIFYQRRLKSQKGLISICELEAKEIEINGKKKVIGPRVIPKASPLFQEFKIWQVINNLKFKNVLTKELLRIQEFDPDVSLRNELFRELNIKGKMDAKTVLANLLKHPKEWEPSNFKTIEGNNTNESLYHAYAKMLDELGYELDFSKQNADEITKTIEALFTSEGIDTTILKFDTNLQGAEIENQSFYQLWHLLYSFEGDNSTSGDQKLFELLKSKFGFEKETAKFLIQIPFKNDYGSLSAKAIKKILPHLQSGHEYSEAASLAGYNHSGSQTKDEIANKILAEKMEQLPKNSLRNPIVEKILNQMVNVVNSIIDEYGRPDEIRIEMARELKKSSKERAEMTANIGKATKQHEEIRKKLEKLYPFNGGVRVTKNDIIKYKLYEELAPNGYKCIYTGQYIPLEKLFTKEIDVEHIIPKAVLFDDSFSNKTLTFRDFNSMKSNKTGIDAVIEKYGENSEGFDRYKNTIEMLYQKGRTEFISKSKYTKLLMKGTEVPDGFIERDLRNTQYIAKKATQMLNSIVKAVVPTTGSITEKLREDWQLIDVLKELNWEKYSKLGLTEYELNKDGNKIGKILDWSKRNDHRHHAMDAIAVAFTKLAYIQYFNHLNARKNEDHKQHSVISAIEKKETTFAGDNGSRKRIIVPPIPIPEFRKQAKEHLEKTLISFKAKNKVVTLNKNRIKGSEITQLTLTPRGQLHKETVYGSSQLYETKLERVGPGFTKERIEKVTIKAYRLALLKRLSENNDDPKKAFSGKNALSKIPLFTDEYATTKVPESVKIVDLNKQYSIRKDINPDNFKDTKTIEKIVDVGIKKLVMQRFREYGDDAKKAFSNLEENPIWQNKEKGICIKKATITGVSNAEPLHYKKDHLNNLLLDDTNKPIPSDFVSTGNNHHVAIYRDGQGKLQEYVVSFYEAVMRKNAGMDVIDKSFNRHLGWEFLFTMKQNEYFVFPNIETGFDPKEIDLLNDSKYEVISPNLFRVQKISTKNYLFAHHLETKAIDGSTLKNKKVLSGITFNFVWNLDKLGDIIKIRLNHIGKIISVGEYV